MIFPHLKKYFPLYWEIANTAAKQSVCTRHKVGAVVVTPVGMISVGFNGTPSGYHTNECETDEWVNNNAPLQRSRRRKTDPAVIHAERNAIDKMTRQGVSTHGCLLFVTRAPCFECSKAICGLGFSRIYYQNLHDDMSGIDLLQKLGIHVERA